MDLTMLGAIRWWAQALAIIFTIVCAVLIIVVLLQKGRGGGLSAAFGGAGGHSAFGSKTGDVFTWVTIVIVGMFLILAMVLTVSYVPYVAEDELAPAYRMPTVAPGGAGATAPTPTGGTADTGLGTEQAKEAE